MNINSSTARILKKMEEEKVGEATILPKSVIEARKLSEQEEGTGLYLSFRYRIS